MYLLDTCTLLWFLHNDSKLPEKVADKIEQTFEVYLSVASLWEIAIKKAINKLDIPETVTELAEACEEKRIVILPIKVNYLESLEKLSKIHNDPFDRLIIATALEENLTLLTDDGKIRQYKEIRHQW